MKNASKDLRKESKLNKSFLAFLLLLITLPIAVAINNILLAIFILTSFFYIKNKRVTFSLALLLPIVLFIWMSLSYFWSIDVKSTLRAIPKESALFLIPFAFLLIPKFNKKQKKMLITYYSYTMVIYVLYFLVRAIFRYVLTNDSSVFFYHGPDNFTDSGLVPRLLNAIHFSVYVAIAFFYFFIKEHKTKIDHLLSILLFVFVLLLSSKNIIIIFLLLILIQVFFYSKIANRLRLRNLTLLVVLFGLIFSFSKIKERFLIEFKTNSDRNIAHNIALNNEEGINNVSIIDAWTKEQFHHSDFFPGAAFRVYQFRIFTEFLKEEPIFWKGFGLNASKKKIVEKESYYNLYPGYGSFNFHNQYVQNFAELGFIGFLLLMGILLINTNKAFKNKDFMHIAFAVLMISLFLTESFLWRQRGVVFFTLFYCLFNSSKRE